MRKVPQSVNNLIGQIKVFGLMNKKATAEDIRSAQEQLENTPNDPDMTMVTQTIWPLGDTSIPIMQKIESDLINFHKTQKTGFYTFQPYDWDFAQNLKIYCDAQFPLRREIYGRTICGKGFRTLRKGVDSLEKIELTFSLWEKGCARESEAKYLVKSIYWVYSDCIIKKHYWLENISIPLYSKYGDF